MSKHSIVRWIKMIGVYLLATCAAYFIMLCRQFLSASSTSSFENLTTAQSFHSFSETMSSFSSEIVRLKSTLHSVFPPYPPQNFINF